ncbi:MAG TPA: hypothetical protein VNN18_07405 [Candidatus Xenobia bacterium]|nr:hypothetical protein [Candidatus Xenobia bacterium]
MPVETARLPRHSERGGSKLQVLFALAVTAALLVAGIRIVPVYIAAFKLEDEVRQKCKFAPIERKAPEVVRQELLKTAQDLDLPLRPEGIQVAPTAGAGLKITVKYTVPVDLIVTQINLPFEFTADSKSAI